MGDIIRMTHDIQQGLDDPNTQVTWKMKLPLQSSKAPNNPVHHVVRFNDT
jgi:hypothetical protein